MWVVSFWLLSVLIPFSPTVFKGFTHISEPHVAVSPHPTHPWHGCTSLLPVQTADSLKRWFSDRFFVGTTTSVIILVWFLKGFVIVIDGTRGNADVKQWERLNKILWPPQCYNCDLLYIYDTEPVFQNSKGGPSEVVLNTVLLATCFKMFKQDHVYHSCITF